MACVNRGWDTVIRLGEVKLEKGFRFRKLIQHPTLYNRLFLSRSGETQALARTRRKSKLLLGCGENPTFSRMNIFTLGENPSPC
jgi:hypothetical protein